MSERGTPQTPISALNYSTRAPRECPEAPPPCLSRGGPVYPEASLSLAVPEAGLSHTSPGYPANCRHILPQLTPYPTNRRPILSADAISCPN